MADLKLIQDFATVLRLHSRGRFLAKIDDKLREAIVALEEHPDDAAKATLTVTIDIVKMQDRRDIKPKVTVKLPEEKGFGPMTLFAVDGGLSVEHPNQIDMFAGPRGVAGERPASSTKGA